jgi:glutamyl-tRNA synthetase
LAWGWQHNRLPAWRLRVRGQACASCGDVVVRRADGFIAYHLASAVDELACGITEVVRGADLAPVRWAQEAVMEAMGQPPPIYRHVPLLCDAHGDKLAKREGSAGLRPLRDQGATPADVVGSLAQGLHLVPAGIALTAQELLARVSSRPQALDACLQA